MTDELTNVTAATDAEGLIVSSTTAENIHAWKALLSSKEAKEFVDSMLEKGAILFGQTKWQKIISTVADLAMMSVAFLCIGLLGWFHLVSDGTTGALAGMIVGYFFKKNS